MSEQQLVAWVQVSNLLIAAGIATWAQIKTLIANLHGTALTDAQLNAIEQGVLDDATRREAQAKADADPTGSGPSSAG